MLPVHMVPYSFRCGTSLSPFKLIATASTYFIEFTPPVLTNASTL